MKTYTTISEQIDRLQNEHRNLINDLRGNNSTTILSQLKVINKKISDLKIEQRLNNFNLKYNKLRELAKIIYDCERPTEDITTNEGYFHATKIKKYPNLAKLEYCRAEYKDNKITSLTVNGNKFELVSAVYNSGQPTTYEYFSSYENFLQGNHIPLKPITLKQYLSKINKLEKFNNELSQAINKYTNNCKKEEISVFNYYGLFDQRNEYLYKYINK